MCCACKELGRPRKTLSRKGQRRVGQRGARIVEEALQETRAQIPQAGPVTKALEWAIGVKVPRNGFG